MSQDRNNVKKSPYKKIQNKNAYHCGYININKLVPNKGYKIYDFEATTHVKYGEGQMAFFTNFKRTRNKAQLPGKYLADLTIPGDIDSFKEDIKANRPPFLVYRYTEPDNSYRIDVVEYSHEYNELFKSNQDFPELETSNVSSSEGFTPPAKKKKDE